MLNRDIRNRIKRAPITTYELAAKLGISQSAIYQRLQRPLTDQERSEILQKIEEAEQQEMLED